MKLFYTFKVNKKDFYDIKLCSSIYLGEIPWEAVFKLQLQLKMQ